MLRKARKSLTKICKTILSLTVALGMALASASPAFAEVEGDINANTEEKPAQEAVAEAVNEKPVKEETPAPAQEKPAPEPVVEESTPEPVEEAPEPEVADDPAFLTDGTANVVDYAVSESGKEFFIIQTANGNSFYLVLDKDRQTDNVYLLSPVDEADLMDFVSTNQTEARAEAESAPVPVQPVAEETGVTAPEPSEPDPAPPATTSAMPLILVAAAIAGGAGYYLKVYMPKQVKNKRPDDLESMEFEDDPEVNEDTPSGDLYVEDELDDAIE